jgi:hypothetical protein
MLLLEVKIARDFDRIKQEAEKGVGRKRLGAIISAI